MNLSSFLPQLSGIPVLMYHKTHPSEPNFLNVPPDMLQQQWAYLKSKGYRAIHLQEFIDIATGKKALPNEKIVLITFDDGYLNNFEFAYPLLKAFNWCATFFIIANTVVTGTLQEEDATSVKMTLKEYHALDPNVVQCALHGFMHENFGEYNLEQLITIMQQSMDMLHKHNIPFIKTLAYPYGSRPSCQKEFTQWLSDNQFQTAFRIGNKINKLPIKDLYNINRIDIRGEDSLEVFKAKLKVGKLKLF